MLGWVWVVGTKLLLLCPLAARGKQGSGRWCNRGEERALIRGVRVVRHGGSFKDFFGIILSQIHPPRRRFCEMNLQIKMKGRAVPLNS